MVLKCTSHLKPGLPPSICANHNSGTTPSLLKGFFLVVFPPTIAGSDIIKLKPADFSRSPTEALGG